MCVCVCMYIRRTSVLLNTLVVKIVVKTRVVKIYDTCRLAFRRASVLLKFSIFSLSTLHSVIERLSSCGDQEEGGKEEKINRSTVPSVRERLSVGEGGGGRGERVRE